MTQTSSFSQSLVGQPKWLSTESYGLLILVFSALGYSFMACFVKLVTSGTAGLPSIEVVFCRAIFQWPLVVLAMTCYTDEHVGDGNEALIRHPFGSKRVRLVVLTRGIIGGVGFCFYYYTTSVLPLGDSTTMLSLNPVITVLAASIFLGEKIRFSHVVAAVLTVVGSILMAKPSFFFGCGAGDCNDHSNSHGKTLGYLTGLLGSCCGAAVYILVRKAGKTGVHTLQLLFSWCLFGFVFSVLFGIIVPLVIGASTYGFIWPSSTESWLYLFLSCMIGTCAHFLMNYAVRVAPAGLASIVRSSSILFSYCIEVFVFHQVPKVSTVQGVALIILSLLIIVIEKHYQEKQQQLQQHQNVKTAALENEESLLEKDELLANGNNEYGSTSGYNEHTNKSLNIIA